MYKSDARCKKVNVKNFVYDSQQVGSKEAHSGQYTERSEVSYTEFLTRSEAKFITRS